MSDAERKPRRGLFTKKQQADPKVNEKASKDDPDSSDPEEKVKAPAVEEVLPVSFSALFRFSTKFELFLDFIGLIAAFLGGAAQPMMTLIFGNLTQSFVNFSIVINEVAEGLGSPADISIAASKFRHVAALDASYLVYIGAAMGVATYTYMNIWVYTAEVNAKRLRERYLQTTLRQNISYFDEVGAGEVATRIQTDTHLVQQGISEKVALICGYLASFFVGFILAYIRQWKLALALSSIIPCIAITGGIMNKFVSGYMQDSLNFVAEGGSMAEEVIGTIRTAHAFGSQPVLNDRYGKFITKSRKVDIKSAFWQGGGMAVFFFVIYSSYALSFSFGTTLINRGEANAGAVVNVFLAILIGSFSLAQLAPEMQAVSRARGAAAKLYATIDRVPEIDSSDPGGLKPEKCEGHITFENVKFNYPSRPGIPILKDLSLVFEAGKTVALVGASGSGKSTIVALVERFYDPLSGVVKVDGINVNDLNLRWLRNQIGLVSQEPVLFATTIRGNVAHGLIGTKWENNTEEEKNVLIKEACVKANADGFISKLPDGYDTMVGERGFLLSGGQKQRVAIARAIVSDPRILLLDEATSALDTQSEGIVQDALDKAAAGRTTITIAHRLSTIKGADCIHVMGEGVVLESGTHDELLQNENGAYARLVHAQKLRENQTRNSDDDSMDSASGDELGEDLEKVAKDEVPLGRRDTGSRSLASEILEQRRKQKGDEVKKEYGIVYLFKRIGSLNPRGYKRYAIGSIFAFCTGAVYPAFGIVYGKAISAFAATDPHVRRVEGDRNALWLFVIAILSTICIGLQNWLFMSAAAQLTSILRTTSFKSILRQDIEFFDRDENSTGSLTSRLSDNPQKVNGLAGITLGTIVQSISTLIVGSIIGLAFSWKLALVGMACCPLVISAGYIRLRVVVLKDQKNRKAHDLSAQLACEAAGAIRTVASLTREGDCCRLYSESLEGPLRQSNRTSLSSNLLYALSQAMSFWVIALVFWYGSVLVSHQEIDTFRFFVALMSVVFGSIQAGNIFSFAPDMSSAKGAASRILDLLDSKPEIDVESNEGQIPKDVQGRIRFENIHFRYPTRPGVRVLKDLSLTVDPGSFVAIVGPSGSGKSTTIQLIERFYDPIAGNVYLDGHRISDLNIKAYRQCIALVSQEPTLYAGTIRFNILLGATKPESEVTEAEIERVCADANILEFIKSLPNGLDTEVGGKGSQLSGGQKQRIAIARALLRNPKVLLLDEATSALDSTSEKVVQAALDVAAKGRTTIAIAHRLSTIQNADCIYFVKDGTISESGTHDQLLALKGGYYEYVQLQALSRR